MGLRERLTALFGGTPKTDLELVLPRSTVTGRLPPDDPTLPPGRLVVADPSFDGDFTTPVMWCSEQPVKKVAAVARALADRFPSTGLWPLVLDAHGGDVARPWLDGEFAPEQNAFAEADQTDVAGTLARWWDDAMADDGEFTGLVHLDGVAFDRLDEGYAQADGKWLGLFAVQRPADVLARIGWMGAVNADASGAELTAVLRSWEDRYGAVLVGLGFDTLVLAVGRPPRSMEDAIRVAAELAAFCPDSVHQGAGDLETLAAALVDAPTWHFWWD